MLSLAFSALAVQGSDTPPPTVIPKDHLALKDGKGNLWWKIRHERKLREIARLGGKVDIVFLGDSIMKNWETVKWGRKSYDALRREWSILNLGYGGDRTQHVLWRCLNGELDGYQAKAVVLLNGTNNAYYEKLPPETIAAGIAKIVNVVREKQPQAVILLMPLLPRYETRNDPLRLKNDRVNELIRPLADGRGVVWMDLGGRFVKEDGAPDPRLFADLCHPNENGYPVWKDAMIPYLRKYVTRCDGPEAKCASEENLPVTLRGGDACLEFESAEKGLGCRSLACGGSSFFSVDGSTAPGLWKLTFRAGVNGEERVVDASDALCGKVEKTASGLRFSWNRIDIELGDAALDVVCDVTWKAESERYEFRIKVDNHSDRFGLFSTDYPCLGRVVKRGEGTAIRPGGNWGGLRTDTPWPMKMIYPGYPAPLQLTIFESGKGEGLLVAALDPSACVKTLALDDKYNFSFSLPAVNAGAPGAEGAPEYPFALYPYTGTWWKAAKHYRKWAVAHADWMKAGPNVERKDRAERYRNAGMWMLVSSKSNTLSNVKSLLDKALERVNGRVPVSVHWYCWHKHPFDTLYPEYFPAKAGFSEAARDLESKGMLIMPYINGRLWDCAHDEFESVRRMACRKEDGTPYTETWNKRDFSPMCQSTQLWRNKIVDIGNRIFAECDVGALYVDQIASMKAVVCYADDHGHPVGGGSYWVDDYRRMMRDIRRSNPGKPVTSENFAEPYVDVFEGFLTWSPNTDKDIPLLTAVYSGYCEPFGCRTAPHYDTAAFRAAQNRSMIWGAQLGWESTWIVEKKYADRFEHLVRMTQLRQSALEFFADGECIGEVKNSIDVPDAEFKWERWGRPLQAKLPGTQATLWKSPEGRLMIAVANHTSVPRDFSCDMLKEPVTIPSGEVRLIRVP